MSKLSAFLWSKPVILIYIAAVAVLSFVGGIAFWTRLGPGAIQTELARFGIAYYDLTAVASKLDDEGLSTVAPLLARMGYFPGYHVYVLDLSGTEVSNLESVKRLDLTNLNLSRTKVSDMEPLRALTNLRSLVLSGTQVSDIEPLRALTNLRWLDLSGTQVSNLQPLRALTKLRRLDLSGTQVSNLQPLQAVTDLTVLKLPRTKVSDIEPLTENHFLCLLDLSMTNVSDLGPLKGLTSLQKLYLSGTQVTSLEPVYDLPKLVTPVGVSDDLRDDFVNYRNRKRLPEVPVDNCVALTGY
jgi:hypothetical protein